jgi:hypothetical protein
MSQAKPVTWFEDDPKPNNFFFRSPFRSWKFVINTVLLVVMCLSYVGVVWNYRGPRYSYILIFLLFNVVYPYWWAIKRHNKIKELYLSGGIVEQPANSPMDSLLQVADDSLNEGLRNSSAMFGIYLLTLVLCRFQHLR